MHWPFLVPISLFGFLAIAVVLRGPIGKAIAERIAGRTPGQAAGLAELDLVERRLEVRITELEERVDFTERLLQRGRSREELTPG